MKNNNICIFGMGFVGLTLAIVLAEKGYIVYGLEINKKSIKNIKNFKPSLYEKNLNIRLKKLITGKKIFIHQKLSSKFICNTYIITVGTPIDSNKNCNFNMIKKVAKEISLKLKDGDHIILRSTVRVGTTRKLIMPLLDRSKRKYYISFCPERTIEGNALKELSFLPQIISGNDKIALEKSKKIFKSITKTIVSVSTLEAAEMIKLVDNMQRDVKFALSNEIALMCEKLNVNVNEVIRLGKYKYPRTNLFDPGPVGGPCLEKDTYILASSFKDKNLNSIALSSRYLNEKVPSLAVKTIKKITNFKHNNIKISILGLAFKGRPETNDTRGTTAIKLIDELKKNFPRSKIYGHDLLVENEFYKKYKIKKFEKINDIFKNSSIVIIHNNHPAYLKMNLHYLSNSMKQDGLIYDFWNIFNVKKSELANNVQYISLGNIS